MPSPRPSQDAIVAALESGHAAGERGPLKRIDTHMSHVFLGRDRVYKLKRSVRHPFADMSTVEARHLACETEITTNRALAEGLYEGVRPLVRDAHGDVRLGGEGEPLDWVVVMRRFRDGGLFTEIADAGRLTPHLVGETADIIAAFHDSRPARTDAGRADDYRRIVAGLRRTEEEGAARLGLAPGSSEVLFASLEQEIAKRAHLIEARREAGFVRHGHGDLHLRNICLFEGRVTPFDALEFDPALATADVVYDLAFLLMDLRARGLGRLANVAMNRYWDASRQPETALALLPLFLAMRAAVRMAVAIEAGELVEAGRYRALGREMLRSSTPCLVAIGGLPGSGKSTLARLLAPDLAGVCGGRLLRTDIVRKELAGAKPNVRLSADQHGGPAQATVYAVLARRAEKALAAGASVVADGTFRETQARAAVETAAAARPFLGLWLRASTVARTARVAARRGEASDANTRVASAQAEPEDLVWHILNADRPIDMLAAEARDLVNAALPPAAEPEPGPPTT